MTSKQTFTHSKKVDLGTIVAGVIIVAIYAAFSC